MVQIENVKFQYKKKKPLFDNLSMELENGKIYGLLGLNGAGKTSLLKIISGLRYYQSGNISTLGYDPKERNPLMMQDIYFVPEEIYLPNISAKMLMELYAPFYPSFDNNLFETLISEFDLKMTEKVKNFSFGQRKKVIISFAIATRAKLIILDEPTNGLDIPSKSWFRKTIASSLNDDQSILISTHQVRDLECLIDTIVVLEKGNVIFNNSIAEIENKLEFKHIAILDESKTIYSEPALNGFNAVLCRTSDIQTKVDIELLFNAIINNSEQIKTILKN